MNKAEKSAHAHKEIMWSACGCNTYLLLMTLKRIDSQKQNVHTTACNNSDEIEGEMAPKITYNYELKLFK